MKALMLAGLLALPLPALAETREERVAVAKEYVELALQGFDMSAMIETMYQPVLQQVAAGGQTLSEDQVGQIRQLYLDTFTEPMNKLMRDQSQIMADMMTLAELTALRDFYATPEGRSVMAKLPQLTAAQQPGIMALINENMSTLMPKVLAIINGEAPPAAPTTQP
ncbi:DUF2059 domain-containing protein [Tabrizicola sp.]|uniref:DUF2059 domain-containing protein n=1 Tax=Tabrizicola sp. TaxID=2005166 RepID=UPI003F2C64D5